MTTCAVIDTAAGKVVNLIVAEATDPIDAGLILQADPPQWVQIGTEWDGANYLGEPPPSQMPRTSAAAPIDGLDTL